MSGRLASISALLRSVDDTGSHDSKTIKEVERRHITTTLELRLQNRRETAMYKFVKSSGYMVSFESKTKKRKREDDEHPLRLTFMNGGACRFPFSEWDKIFACRAQDLQDGFDCFCNEMVLSSEGVQLFVEFDYRGDSVPTRETILSHVTTSQEVVRDYYSTADTAMWVLLSNPKPKLVKTQLTPIVAMGCHVVFPNITVTCEQGKQICSSISLRLEGLTGLTGVVDEGCYGTSTASLRPMMCRKLEDCKCDPDVRYDCPKCLGRGRVPSGSIYKPSYFFDRHGTPLIDPTAMTAYTEKNLQNVIKSTSIVPAEACQFTPGYARPLSEPVAIPELVRSKHPSYAGKHHAFKADRRVNPSRWTEVLDPVILDLVKDQIKAFHPRYRERCLLGTVSRCKHTISVNLKGAGRSFCRIQVPEGVHSSNRIFFQISKAKGTITQKCYKCKYDPNRTDLVGKLSNAAIAGMFTVVASPIVAKSKHATLEASMNKL